MITIDFGNPLATARSWAYQVVLSEGKTPAIDIGVQKVANTATRAKPDARDKFAFS
jgi:hypothetical protein